MSNWEFLRLEQIAAPESGAISKPYGSAILREDYRPAGVPVVRGVNLSKGIFHDDDFVYIAEDVANKMPGARLAPGDLVITHRGTVGQVSMIPRSPRFERYATSTSQVKVRLDPNQALPEFYYYWFSSPAGRRSLLEHTSTVGVPGIAQPVSTIKGLAVPLPPIKSQRAIAEVFGALDDKIAANTQLIATADSLAQAHFHAVLNESQSMPLSSLAEFVNGKAFTKGASGTGRVVVRIAELNSGIGNSTVYSDAEVDDKHVVRSGDTLFAWSGSLTLHRWFRDEAIVNQHIFKVIPNGVKPSWLIYELLRNKLEDFKMIAADKATTMGHIQRKHLDEPVLVPNESIQREIAPVMESLWTTALNTERENLSLAATRDTLLPQLMSGKLHVREAEDAVTAVI